MIKSKHVFLLFLCLIVFGCATYEPMYKEPFEASSVPVQKEIEKSFYLIGDAGYAQPGQSTPALLALEKYLKKNQQTGNYAIFLGDNIYPDGMPDKEAKDRPIAEHRLDVQIDAVKNFDGQVYFIPGNHDWYNEGLKGLKREEDYFESKLRDNQLFRPKTGCAFESIEVTENIQLMILDSQWFLEDWDKHPTINDNCPEIKTREALFAEIEGEFKKNQNKTTVFVLHHPLYTNGVHGGKFAIDKHLFPSQKKIPLPILASLVQLIRTSGGVSSQDNMNKQYKQLVNRLETLCKATTAGNIVFASGHEHSIQYIEHNGLKQIVSGSGAKNSYATLGNDGLFAYAGQGFARLDIFTDGSSQVSYYGATAGTPELLFVSEVFPEKKKFNVDTLPSINYQTKEASVYETKETEKTELYEGLWGEFYRELYGTKIKAKVALLDTLYGGLEVVRKGGGHQTRSLRLKDKEGREYNMRALKKSSVLFLQSILFKESYVAESLENTVPENILEDFYTASHPYGFLAVPHLSKALGIYHTNPQLFYVPKQKALGDYNTDYGDELYMIVERPEDGHNEKESFGKPDDIESTSDLFERIRKDEKYTLDESAYVKARLFDMLLGDWDRHEDQWRWAEFELENGDHLLRPIPRDRDQVFSNFDGAFLGTLRGLVGVAKQFQEYEDDIEDVKWMNIAALRLDRSLLNNTSLETWIEQANFIKDNLTDAEIENAFTYLPDEVQGKSTQEIIGHLKARRENLPDIAKRYYKFLAKLAIVTGTDKDDYIEIERASDGKTRIAIYRIKDGQKADLVNEKIYDRKWTKDIWVYGLDDDDIFDIYGKPDNPIRIRVIGGQNNDIYRVRTGRKITIYDHKSKPNTVESKGGARFRFTDNYRVNLFDKDQRIFNSGSILPAFGFNPDDGVRVGLTSTSTYNAFFRNPFTRRHRFRAGYYFATEGFDIEYTGEFAGLLGNYNLLVGALYTSPNFTENFFGFGNETENNQDDQGFNYNRVRISTLRAELGLVKTGRFGSYFNYKILFEGVEVDRNENRIVGDVFTEENRIFDRQWFGGAEVTYRYESYDIDVNPRRGFKFEVVAGAKLNLDETERAFGYFKPHMGFYNAISKNKKLVLRTAADAHILLSRDYEFYQSAQLGGDNLLRGYRTERFSGQTAFAGSADLRYSFDQFKTRFLPLQIGIFAGADTGRVWLKGTPDADVWHSDFGGGFWINSTDAIQGTFNLFSGEDDLRFSFSLLFRI